MTWYCMGNIKRLEQNLKNIGDSHKNFLLWIENNLKNNPKMFWFYINNKSRTSSILNSMT